MEIQNALLNTYLSLSISCVPLPSDCSFLGFLQLLNVNSCYNKLDLQVIVYQHNLLRRWRLCRRCVLLSQKLVGPAVQLALCLRDILDCSLQSVHRRVFYPHNKAFFVVTAAFVHAAAVLYALRHEWRRGVLTFWLPFYQLTRFCSWYAQASWLDVVHLAWLNDFHSSLYWQAVADADSSVLQKIWQLKSCPLLKR